MQLSAKHPDKWGQAPMLGYLPPLPQCSAASMPETVTGYRLVIGEFQLADELLEIQKTSSGSKVDFFQRVAWMLGVGRTAIEAAVRECL